VTDADGGVTRYEYDPAGNLARIEYPNGTDTTHSFDALNRLVLMETRDSGGQMVSRHAYTLAADGKRVHAVEFVNGEETTVQYAYDRASRLVEETRSRTGAGVIFHAVYTYDAAGNRLTKTENGITTHYTYNNLNQLVSEISSNETISYAYNLLGQLSTKASSVSGTVSYAYNELVKLSAVTAPDGSVSTLSYDLNGNLSGKGMNGLKTASYLVDPTRNHAEVLVEYDGSRTANIAYTFGLDLISMKGVTGVSYHHGDGLGSVRALTNVTGAVTDTYLYEAFGKVIAQTGATPNPHLFTGERYDANTGFYYLRARMYDPSAGRFTSVDPFGGLVHDPATIHKYLYTMNNPVNRTDPSGECSYGGLSVGMSAMPSLATLQYSFAFMGLHNISTTLKVANCYLHPLYTALEMTLSYYGSYAANGAVYDEQLQATVDAISLVWQHLPRLYGTAALKTMIAVFSPIKWKLVNCENLYMKLYLDSLVSPILYSWNIGKLVHMPDYVNLAAISKATICTIGNDAIEICKKQYDLNKLLNMSVSYLLFGWLGVPVSSATPLLPNCP
jgi:RHS repeat-associated protein